ncbi:MAG TPA: S-layer homology domain-containing protein [Anaerovoracaceae bacterium]|nr:S-layer homology domain-containing protein [Anaerovoracaceae bacterium]
MKKMLSMIMTAALVMALFSGTAFANNGNGNGNGKDKMKEFKDMKGHWGTQSVEKMQTLGILDGYADGTFQPDRTLTQGELAVIIARILEVRQDKDQDLEDDDATVEEDGDLSDVPAWAKDAVSEGFQKHYLNMKRFHSHVQCDRLTAVVAIAKALDLEPVTDFTNNPFKDRKLINDEDYGYLLALYEAGYINGYPDGNFNPNSFLSRAQIASIIDKLLDGDVAVSDDKTAPDWDSDSEVTAAAIGATSVKLEWSAADDDVAVVGYRVLYEDSHGKDLVQYAKVRTITITGLEPEEDYTFTVEAKDAAGNWSDDGPSVDVTTIEAVEDSESPSWSNDSVVTATAIRVHSVDLKWSGASDDVKVVAYKVIYEYNDKVKTTYIYNATTARISDLVADEEYTFTIEAKDAAGNLSDDGPSVEVTTLEENVADTAAPTWPSGADLTISASESGILTIVWPDAEDNVGISAYKIYQDGHLIDTMVKDANSATVSGLNADTEYTFKVRAMDAAGNLSTSLSKAYLTE